MQKPMWFVVLGALQGALACSDSGALGPSDSGNGATAGTPASGGSASGGSASGGSASGGAAGNASPSGGAGGGASGGGTGNGGAMPAGGASGAAGTTTAGAASGGSGTAGGGTGGATGGGGAGGGGAGGAALTAIANELHEFRLECPCIDADHFGADKQDNCDSTPAVDRQTHQKHLGGDPSVVYDVKLHVRGNTEPNTYVNGKLEQQRFYIGGQTSTPGYTAYMLTVADPQQTYFFNYNPTTGHIHFLIDYEVVIPMRGGTAVTFEVNGGKSVPDGHGVSNREALVVPGIPPAPDPFNGQLVQFDVVSVQPRPQ